MEHMGPGGVLCLTGLSSGGRSLGVDAGMLNRTMVLENEAVVGSVNAEPTTLRGGGRGALPADKGWLGRMISRTVPLQQFGDAFDRRPDDIKVVIEVAT